MYICRSIYPSNNQLFSGVFLGSKSQGPLSLQILQISLLFMTLNMKVPMILICWVRLGLDFNPNRLINLRLGLFRGLVLRLGVGLCLLMSRRIRLLLHRWCLT